MTGPEPAKRWRDKFETREHGETPALDYFVCSSQSLCLETDSRESFIFQVRAKQGVTAHHF